MTTICFYLQKWKTLLSLYCLQVQKWCPYKGRGVVPEPVCANKMRNGPASANQGFLQPAKAAAMCTAPRAETRPPPPIPPFLLAQTYLQNGLRQLITVAKVRRCHMASSVLKGLSLPCQMLMRIHIICT